MASVHTLVALFGMACFPSVVVANAFLSKEGLTAQPEPVGDLMVELGRLLGEEHRLLAEKRVDRLEEAMRPTFLSLPREADGRLHSSGVRLLLHRLFVSRHGWFVRGLANEKEAWDKSSSAAATLFVEDAGDGAIIMFENRPASEGMTLREVAALGASLESLIQSEAIERLRAAYRVNNLSTSEKEHDTELIMDTYMAMYVLNVNYTVATSGMMQHLLHTVDSSYSGWKATRKWMHEIRKDVLRETPRARHSFETTALVLEEVAERYGRFQDQECIELKHLLVKIEQGGTGRVPLQDFYGAYLNGTPQFAESKLALTLMGALDESDPQRPSVIIPNYLSSSSNCLAGSKYYAVCCISECEDLLGHLERTIAAPVALPRRIVEIVEELPSATVDAPRKLPVSLVKRLEDIAKHHDGKVPLHGRLFSQWMHHAYPRECPYPQLSSVAKSLNTEPSIADPSEMLEHIEQCRAADSSAKVELSWSHEEELYVRRTSSQPDARLSLWKVFRNFLLVVVSASMAITIAKTVQQGIGASPHKSVRKETKWMV